MLTKRRLDTSHVAKLLAMMTIFDWAKPSSDSAEDAMAKFIELDESWHIRAFLAQEEILKSPPNKSRILRAGSFLDPIEDVLSKRLRQMNTALGPAFSLTIEIVMDTGLYARVFRAGQLEYKIEIGLALIVQIFLGAITLSQPGSMVSSNLPNPYQSKYGKGAGGIFESQAPLLQALNASAFNFLLPEEPWRRLLAYELFSKAIEFAFHHEYGHATRGHLEFLESYGLPANRSAEAGAAGQIESLTHQLLESQADDTAAQFIVAKCKMLSEQHSFQDSPFPLGRYGFCVTCATDAHRIVGYALTLLFFVFDAAGRGARLVGEPVSPRDSLYPTAAYRAWRALSWQKSFGGSSGNWLDYVEPVRSDLAEDKFPDADSVFRDQLNEEQIVAFDTSLMNHSKLHEEGRTLMDFEASRKGLVNPQRPLSAPRYWGEPGGITSFLARNLFGSLIWRKK